jgi:hypothetical protein
MKTNQNKRRCTKCNAEITKTNWSRHLKTKKHLENDPDQTIRPGQYRTSNMPTKQCEACNAEITKTNWSRHLKTKTHLENDPNQAIKPKLRQQKPQKIFTNPKKAHKVFNFSSRLFDTNVRTPNVNIPKVKTEKSIKSRLITYQIENTHGFIDTDQFLDSLYRTVSGIIRNNLKNKQLKTKITLLAEFKKDEKIYEEKNFKTKTEIITKATNLGEFYSIAKNKISNEMEAFELKSSGWVLNRILRMKLNINRYNPLRGSSYIPLPQTLAKKKAIINIKNDDDKCFLWSILAKLHPADKDPQRVSKYKEWENEFDEPLKGIKFPVKLSDVSKFAKRTDMSINIYCYDNSCIAPLKITKEEKEKHIDLLYLTEKGNNHYCWIKNMSRLVSSQVTKHEKKTFLCKMCLNSFYSEAKLADHKTYCSQHKSARVEMPKPYNNTIEFKNYNHSLKVPFKVYADFECMLQKVQTCQPSDETSYTNAYQKHVPNNFVYHIKYTNNDYKPPVVYSGVDAPKVFYEKLKEDALHIAKKYYDKVVPMNPLTEQEKKEFKTQKNCHICEKSLNLLPPILVKKLLNTKKAIEYYASLGDEKLVREYTEILKETEKKLKSNKRKVADHDHLTGQFRGAAHSYCNLNYKNPKFIPIFFHNLAGYDAHLFIKEFGEDNGDIKLIPNTEEKYISFSKMLRYDTGELNDKGNPIFNTIELRFIDSFKFLSSSLDKLAKNLRKDQFKELSKYFPKEHLDLITRKLAYPYEYMDSPEKYKETYLPPIEKFYSSLNKENVNEEEYRNAQEIWDKFKIKNLEDFTNLYNKIDVLLLADIIENFVDISLKTYKLDPAWYYTTPGFAWDCMLKMTKQKFELLTDYDMVLMIENGLRGGISHCSNRYAKANNKYIGDKYDKSKESIFLEYVDANNLYGWAMSKYLPYGGFRWSNTNIDVLNMLDNSPKGYILEVDLSYPKELHDLHSDLPLAPENNIKNEKLPKLFTTLYDKEKYVVHYTTLKQYLKQGLKLEKIHRVLEFDQSDWLKVYIDFNTALRTKATNDFEKDFFKLMNNSVFGKTMENIRNRVDIKLCSDKNKVEKLIAKPNFESATIFTENLAAIHMTKTNIVFNKPIYIGMSILDISKNCMYDFYYNTIKEKYNENVKLLYMDTDSLIMEIKTDDFYNDMKSMINEFDTSDYLKDNAYGMPLVNKKVLGKFKDELNGKIMDEFIGLRSKLYAYKLFANGNETKKAKGVKKNVVQKEICFDDFRKCLLTKEAIYKKQNIFRTNLHNIYTVEQNKKL